MKPANSPVVVEVIQDAVLRRQARAKEELQHHHLEQASGGAFFTEQLVVGVPQVELQRVHVLRRSAAVARNVVAPA